MRVLIAIILLLSIVGPAGGQTGTERVWFEKIGSLYHEDSEKVLEEISSFQKAFPGSKYKKSIQFLRGETLFAAGRYKEALAEYEMLERELRIVKENLFLDAHRNIFLPVQEQFAASLLYRLGETHYNLGQYPQAARYFHSLVENYPDDYLASEAILGLGLTYEKEGNSERAESYFSRLVKEYRGYESNQHYIFMRGLIFYQRKDYKEAVSYFDKIYETAHGLYFAGLCREQLGDFYQAIKNYEDLIRGYPDSPYAIKARYHIAETIYLSGDLKSALSRTEEFRDKFVDDELAGYGSFRIAYIHYANKEYVLALRVLSGLEEKALSPELLTMTYSLKGGCYYALEEYEKAINAFQIGMDKLPPQASAWKAALMAKMVYLYMEQGLFARGMDTAERFLSLYPQDRLAPEILFLTAVRNYFADAYPQAKLKCEEVLSKYPNTEGANKAGYLLALMNFKKGDYDALVTNYRYLLSPSGLPSLWSSRIYLLVAEAYENLGFQERAQQVYLNFLRDYPDSLETSLAFRNFLSVYIEEGKESLALKESARIMPEIKLDKNTLWEVKLASGDASFNLRDYAAALEEYKFLSQMEIERQAEEKASVLYKQGLCYRGMGDYDSAVNLWKDVSRQYPGTEWSQRALFTAGETRFNEGKLSQAIEIYGECIDLYPSASIAREAVRKLGDAYFNLRDYDRAASFYENFIRQYSGDAEIRAVKDKYYLTLSHSDPDKLIVLYPESSAAAEIYWQKGVDAFSKGNYRLAIEEFEKLRRYTPTHKHTEPAIRWMGECLYRLQNYEKAKEIYASFVTQYAHADTDIMVAVIFGLAESEYALKNYTAAEKGYKEVVFRFSRMPQAPLAQLNLMYLYEDMGRWEDLAGAGEYFMKQFPENENLPSVRKYLSWAYQEKLKESSRAIVLYQTMLKEDTSSLEIRYHIAQSHYTGGDISEAIKVLEEARAMGPLADAYWVDCYLMLADLYRENERWEEAIDAYKWLSRMEPDKDWIEQRVKIAQGRLYNLAWEFQQKARYDNAIEIYKMLETGKVLSAVEARYHIGVACRDKGDTEKAVIEFEQMAGLAPSPPTFKVWVYGLFSLGEIYEGRDDWEKALRAYRRIATIKSDDAEIRQLQKNAADLVAYLEKEVIKK